MALDAGYGDRRQDLSLNYGAEFRAFDLILNGLRSTWGRIGQERDRSGRSHVGGRERGAVDVERTIEAILEAQSKTEARAAKHEARMEAMELRIQEARARGDSRLELVENRLNRRIDGTNKLIQQGMRILVKIGQNVSRVQKNVDDLAAAQKETQRTLRTFIASIQNGRHGKGRNGH